MAKKTPASKKHVYASISKVEDQEDGTIKVFGIASTDSEDSDGETITADCMRNAIPDYMKFGAVREMHQAKAAGTALEINVNDQGVTEFCALVVDDDAIKKVKTEVYKGFSIGGKVTERDPLNKKIIKGLNLIEVSLVDRPANPDAVISMYKAAKTQEEEVSELAELLDAGEVTPGELLDLVRAAKAAGVPLSPTEEQTLAAAGTPTPLPPTGERESGDDAAAKADTPEPTAEDTVQKGMYSLSSFASTLESIGWLISDAEYEAQWEADNSPIPQALREWLNQGIAIFKAMTEEETSELVARLQAQVPTPDKVAAAGVDLAKRGAKFSAATKEALKKIHGACKEASEHLDGLKYDADEEEDDAGKAASATDPDTDGIAKAVGLEDMINKALAPFQEQLTKVTKENETLKAQVTAMGKQAAPGKALLKAISKAADVVSADDVQPTEPLPPEGTPERAQYELKKALGNGGVRIMG